MFVGNVRNLNKSAALESYFTRVDFGPIVKHKTRLQRLARYNH